MEIYLLDDFTQARAAESAQNIHVFGHIHYNSNVSNQYMRVCLNEKDMQLSGSNS